MSVEAVRQKVQRIANVVSSLSGADLDGKYYTERDVQNMLFDLGEVGADAVSWVAMRDAASLPAADPPLDNVIRFLRTRRDR